MSKHFAVKIKKCYVGWNEFYIKISNVISKWVQQTLRIFKKQCLQDNQIIASLHLKVYNVCTAIDAW